MAYSANGNNFPDKRLSRVSYDLLVYASESFSSESLPGDDIPDAYLISGDEIILD